MNGRAWGIVCAVSGLALAFSGWKLKKSQEHPVGTTGFEGPGLNRRGLLMLSGEALLILGLILASIIAALFFIGG
jgi:hypothetical protein